MLLLKKILPIWLFPPGLVLLLLAAILILGPRLFQRRYRLPAYILTGLSFLLLWCASIEPVSRRLQLALEDRYPAWDGNSRGAQFIVVLGGGTIGASPDAMGAPVPSGEAFRRVAHAAKVQRRTGLPVIATGGVVFERPGAKSEAEVMKEAFIGLGVPAASVLTETRSRDTSDNARMTWELACKNGLGKRALLVTSAYHMPRAMLLFRRVGFDPIPVPTDYKIDRGPSARRRAGEALLSWMPQASELHRTTSALREHLGLWFYRNKPAPP